MKTNKDNLTTFRPFTSNINQPENIINYFDNIQFQTGLNLLGKQSNSFMDKYLNVEAKKEDITIPKEDKVTKSLNDWLKGINNNTSLPIWDIKTGRPTNKNENKNEDIIVSTGNILVDNALKANIWKESGGISRSEDFYYKSVGNIRRAFQSRVSNLSDDVLKTFLRNPQKLANFVYGNQTAIGKSMGNVNYGDGWKFRGRGLIQLTGKNNYKYYGDKFGIDLVSNPDLANDVEIAKKIAVEFVKVGLKNKKIPETQKEVNRLVTQIIGGNNLNLDKDYGAELLAKVNSYKY